MNERILGSLIVAAALGGCAHGTYDQENPPPVVVLGDRRDILPEPGLCRINPPTGSRGGYLSAQCAGLEKVAPPYSEILYRPRRTSYVVVCYLNGDQPPKLLGMDVFNINSGSLVRSLLTAKQEAPSDNCQEGYAQLARR